MILTKRTDIFLSAVAVLTAATLISATAWGQSPPDAGRLLEETQKTVPLQPVVKPKEEISVPQGPVVRERNETKIFVKGFTFSMDSPVAAEAELEKVVQGYTSREATFGELEQAADKVAQYLKGKGYLLAKAYLPQQDILDGMIRIAVLVGKNEGGSKAEGSPTRLKESVVERIMNQAVKAGEPVRMADLERGILLVNDLPGVTAATSLSAGSTPGTTRVTVKTNQGPLMTGSATFDNFGNRFTGSERLIGAININNPSGYGDLITLNGVQAGEPVFDTDGGKMYMWKAGWQVPIGYSGLKFGVAYTYLGYRIGEELEPTDSSGTAKTWTLNASYPLVRGREYNLYANISYEHRALLNLLAGSTSSDKRINAGTAGIQGDVTDSLWGGGYSAYGLQLTGGGLDLGNWPVDLDIDQQTRKTNGSYWKLFYNGSRQQNLGEGYSIYGAFSGQFASKGLDSSEQITLGGPTGVRAYPSGEATGDQGALLSAELRKDFAGTTLLGHWQAVAFYDFGWVQQHKNLWDNWNGDDPGIRNSYSINGAGAGLNLSNSTQHLKYLVNAFWAATIGSNPGQSATGHDSDGKNLNNRFWIQGSIYF